MPVSGFHPGDQIITPAGRRATVKRVVGITRAVVEVMYDEGPRKGQRKMFRCAAVRKATPPAPRFHRVAPGDYETADGRYRLIQLDGGATRAWNVEYTEKWQDEWRERTGDWAAPDIIVDGAATKRDAIHFFAQWWAEENTDSKETR